LDSLKKPHFTFESLKFLSLHFTENFLKKPIIFYKSLTLMIKSLYFFENVFLKASNYSKCL
jgi:hypothetical protein